MDPRILQYFQQMFGGSSPSGYSPTAGRGSQGYGGSQPVYGGRPGGGDRGGEFVPPPVRNGGSGYAGGQPGGRPVPPSSPSVGHAGGGYGGSQPVYGGQGMGVWRPQPMIQQALWGRPQQAAPAGYTVGNGHPNLNYGGVNEMSRGLVGGIAGQAAPAQATQAAQAMQSARPEQAQSGLTPEQQAQQDKMNAPAQQYAPATFPGQSQQNGRLQSSALMMDRRRGF